VIPLPLQGAGRNLTIAAIVTLFIPAVFYRIFVPPLPKPAEEDSK